MYRNLLLVALLMLCIVTVSQADWVQVTPQAHEQAQLELTGQSDGSISFEWSTSGFDLFETEEGYAVSISSNRVFTDENSVESTGGFVRLPWGQTANLVIRQGEFVAYNPVEDQIEETFSLDQVPGELTFAELGSSMIWRDITVAPLTIRPVLEEESGRFLIATNLDIEVQIGSAMEGISQVEPMRPISREFWPLYQSLVLNELDDLGTRLATTRGTYLILSASSTYMAMMADFITWKTQMGYTVVTHTFTGEPSADDVMAVIQDHWDNDNPPLEYVLLVGDANRGSTMPHYMIRNPRDVQEIDATDWAFTTVEGNDYLPEFMIGRFPVGTSTELLRMVAGTIQYEADPFASMNSDRWYAATVVAANYAEGGLTPLTPVATSQWLAERMHNDWGVEMIDTLFWRLGGVPVSGDDIIECVNRGTSYLTYRGWGNAGGWVEPALSSSDLNEFTNVNYLFVATSFVCATGDFASSGNGGKCFGEHMVTLGTPNAPKGAVAFVGPTDLHTSTKFNNPLLSGFYTGVYAEGLNNISQALVRAKMELINAHPLDNNTGPLPDNASKVQFYWHVYHVLGDPSLSMWSRAPRTITVDFDGSIPLGQDYIAVTLTRAGNPVTRAYVSITREGELISGSWANSDGTVNLPLTGINEASELTLTVTGPNYEAFVGTFDVEAVDQYVSVNNWTVDAGGEAVVIPGHSFDLEVVLENTGTAAQGNVSATLSHPNGELVSITSADADFGAIASGTTADNASSPFQVTVLPGFPTETDLELTLEISGSDGGPWTGKIWVPVGVPRLHFDGYEVSSGQFQPGNDASLDFTFTNLGIADLDDISITVESWDEAVTVNTATASLGSIAQGATGSTATPIEVSVVGNTYRGRVVQFGASITQSGTAIGHTHFSIALEGATASDPLGPDGYGYFAYDNTDASWPSMRPTYQWPDLESMELEPAELSDDENFTVTLPFDFTFYGDNYPSGSVVTVSSNGWISLYDEEVYTKNYFRNWNLPSTLGPRDLIAPFWDDLRARPEEQIEVYTYYDEANHTFIFEWPNAVNRFGWETEVYYPAEFAIVLYDPAHHETPTGDGIIEFQYRNIENIDENNNGATIGIEDPTHHYGLEYSYARQYPAAAAELSTEMAVRFTTQAPDNYIDVEEREDGDLIPTDFALHAPYPNPFNPATEINFDLPSSGHVRLAVYNMLGQQVALLVDREMTAGQKEVVWDVSGMNLSSGIFFLHLQADGQQAFRKLMYIK